MANFFDIFKTAGPFANLDFSIFTIIELRMPGNDRFRFWARVNSKLGLGNFEN